MVVEKMGIWEHSICRIVCECVLKSDSLVWQTVRFHYCEKSARLEIDDQKVQKGEKKQIGL